MIRISNIHLPLDYTSETVLNKAAKLINVDKKFFKSCTIFRRSIDARKKDNIFFLATVDAELFVNEEKICKKFKNAEIAEKYEYNVEKFRGTVSPVVVGAGPAGLFAALILAQSGANPILIERGRDVDTRTEDVHNFWKNGILDTTSNVQFGEGGAGAFSDGKLTTGTKDTRQRKVLIEFVKHGAPDEILYNAKPHIGTDKLRPTVKSIRNEIIRLGGKVMFETKLIGFSAKDNSVTGAEIEHNGTKQTIDTNAIILAIGHSARDTFEMLNEKAIPIEAKAFSVGARIEHHREMIDKSQYGRFAGNKALGAASYKTNVHLENGRGVYTFCMCPGGYVVNASSEPHRLAVNGMSYSKRNGQNANTAVIVTVTPEDFGSSHPLAGVEFQRKLEENAYREGNGKVPVQLFGDFCKNIPSQKLGDIIPQIKGMYRLANVRRIFPEIIADSLQEGVCIFDQKLPGYARKDAVISGVESRTSSPVRIIRDDSLQSEIRGIYPCGEGAGYAGGITSAAMDGIKIAEMIAGTYRPLETKK
mgnify:CR=1 FL=1